MGSIFKIFFLFLLVVDARAGGFFDKTRDITKEFNKSVGKTADEAVKRSERFDLEKSLMREQSIVEQSPVDLCTENPKLPQCVIFQAPK